MSFTIGVCDLCIILRIMYRRMLDRSKFLAQVQLVMCTFGDAPLTPSSRHVQASAIQKRSTVDRCRVRIVLGWRPTGELFVIGWYPGTWLCLETDHSWSPRQDGVPYPRQNIDTPEAVFRRFLAEPVALRDCTVIVEEDHVRYTFQNEK